MTITKQIYELNESLKNEIHFHTDAQKKGMHKNVVLTVAWKV